MDNDDERLRIDKEEENEYHYHNKNKKSHFGIFIGVIVIIAALSGVYFGLNGASFSSNGKFAENMNIIISSLQQKIFKENSSASASGSQEEETSSASSSSSSSALANSKNVITFDSSTKSIFRNGTKGFFHFSKDGAKFYDYSQNQVWNYTYTMSSITVFQKGNYAAVIESRGRNLRMYDSSGELYNITLPGNIINVYINESGGVAVLLKCDGEYRTQVYSNTGEVVFERYEQDSGIYPVSAALSDDGKIVSVSYIDTSGVEVMTKILFFYTNRNDSKNTDTGDFFAAIEKTGQIVPMCGYSSKNGFVFLGDKEIFGASSDGKEIWTTELTNKIDSAYISSDGSVVAALGSELSNKDGHEEGTVVVYNQNGEEKVIYSMNGEITYLNALGGNIIVGSGRNFVDISYSGKVRWQYTASQDISDIIELSGNDVLVVTSTRAEIKKSSDLEKAEIE